MTLFWSLWFLSGLIGIPMMRFDPDGERFKGSYLCPTPRWLLCNLLLSFLGLIYLFIAINSFVIEIGYRLQNVSEDSFWSTPICRRKDRA